MLGSKFQQSARRDPSQLIAGHLQTLSENSLLCSVLSLTLIVFLIFDRAS